MSQASIARRMGHSAYAEGARSISGSILSSAHQETSLPAPEDPSVERPAGNPEPAVRRPAIVERWVWLADYPLATWHPYALHPGVLNPAAPVPGKPLVVLVDDARTFRDKRPHLQVRTSDEAVELVSSLVDRHIDELWLDYDLLNGDTAARFVDYLVRRADGNAHVNAGRIFVHTSKVTEGRRMVELLGAPGRYAVSRNYSAGIWTRLAPT